MDGQTITDIHSISPQGKEVKPMQVNQAAAKKLIEGWTLLQFLCRNTEIQDGSQNFLPLSIFAIPVLIEILN